MDGMDLLREQEENEEEMLEGDLFDIVREQEENEE
jgi:hypothetical protein